MICVSNIIQNFATLDSWSVSDIIHDDAMLDSWPMYLTLYRMMLDSWSVYLTFTEWCHVGLMIYVSDIIKNGFMLDSWSVYLTFTEWCHVGLVICVSDIVQNDAMLDSWSVHLTLYRMTPCWTRDLCIWHYTEWWDHESNMASFCIMSDAQITSPTSFCIMPDT